MSNLFVVGCVVLSSSLGFAIWLCSCLRFVSLVSCGGWRFVVMALLLFFVIL